MTNNKSISQFQTFDELFEDTYKKVIGFGVTSEPILQGLKRGFRLLKPIMEEKGVLFSKDIALAWLTNAYPSDSGAYYSYWRLIHLLDENQNGTLTEWRAYHKERRPIQSEGYLSLLSDYVDHLKSLDYRKDTIDFKRRCARELLFYLESEKILSLEEWDHACISSYTRSKRFMNRKPKGVQAELSRLRHFLDYLFDKKLIGSKLSEAVLTFKVPVQRVVTTMSPESQEILLKPIENSHVNKRNKAISLLSLRCGLRRGDALHVKFEDIDPRKRMVTIIQSKTGNPISRYIPNDAMDALIDYLKNERRESDSPYIFLRDNGPKRPLVPAFSTARHFKRVDKSLQPAEYGLHILRRTNGSDLAKAGMEIDKVGKALGHTTMDNVDKYLSTDEEKMKACALEVGPFDYKGDLF